MAVGRERTLLDVAVRNQYPQSLANDDLLICAVNGSARISAAEFLNPLAPPPCFQPERTLRGTVIITKPTGQGACPCVDQWFRKNTPEASLSLLFWIGVPWRTSLPLKFRTEI